MRRVLLSLVVVTAAAAAPHAQEAPAARSVIEQAAQALGGLDRIQRVRNITLIGYAQYAYQFGGGNVASSQYAPQKWQAANDLRRVYDLDNNRFFQQERRGFVFPFGGPGGHSFELVRQFLDGNVAFDLSPEGMARRIGDNGGAGVLQLDGPRTRRMWMLNNPVVALRAALDPSSTLSRPRLEDDRSVVDVRLRDGETFSLGFDHVTRVPVWIKWVHPHDNLGEVTFTTHFTAYAPYSGIQLPLGYATTIDWRDVVYFSMMVDGYLIDTQLNDLAAPQDVGSAPEPRPQQQPVQAQKIADHIWKLTGGTTVVEFDDHLTLYELGGGPEGAQARIDFAATLVPGKRPTQLILSHNHFDHITGVRTAVANGITIIAQRNMEGMLREITSRPAPNFPDRLARNPQSLKFIGVEEQLRLSDRLMTMDVYHTVAHNHMAESLFAYIPAARVMMEGDLATATGQWNWWADSYLDNIEHYKLDVATLLPVHGTVMTHAQALEFVRKGKEGVLTRCADTLKRGEYIAGCPAFFPRP